MIDFRTQVLKVQLEGALRRAPEVATRELATAFRVIGSRFQRKMLKERLRKSGGASRGAGGRFVSNKANDSRGGLFRRTGALARGFNTQVRGKSDINRLRLVAGWMDPKTAQIANTHEFGGTIRPKNSRYLTVPLPAALTPAGVLRAPARQWAGTFFLRSRKGALLLVQKKGKEIEPLFVLRESVKIPARLGFRETWDSQEVATERLELMSQAIAKAYRSVGL